MDSSETTCGQLMARTIFYVDRHDIDGFIDLFHSDASLEARNQHYSGHAAIRTFMQSRDPARITRHVLGTPCILVDGMQAQGVAYFALYEGVKCEGLPPIGLPASIGEFHQEYRMDADGWRVISHRSVRVFHGNGT